MGISISYFLVRTKFSDIVTNICHVSGMEGGTLLFQESMKNLGAAIE